MFLASSAADLLDEGKGCFENATRQIYSLRVATYILFHVCMFYTAFIKLVTIIRSWVYPFPLAAALKEHFCKTLWQKKILLVISPFAKTFTTLLYNSTFICWDFPYICICIFKVVCCIFAVWRKGWRRNSTRNSNVNHFGAVSLTTTTIGVLVLIN